MVLASHSRLLHLVVNSLVAATEHAGTDEGGEEPGEKLVLEAFHRTFLVLVGGMDVHKVFTGRLGFRGGFLRGGHSFTPFVDEKQGHCKHHPGEKHKGLEGMETEKHHRNKHPECKPRHDAAHQAIETTFEKFTHLSCSF